MADTPEAKMKKKVDKVLKEAGVWFFAPQSGIYGRSGIPDRIGILPGGRMIAVEVKADPTKKPTELQKKVIGEMMDAGAIVWLVDSDLKVEALRTALKLGVFD